MKTVRRNETSEYRTVPICFEDCSKKMSLQGRMSFILYTWPTESTEFHCFVQRHALVENMPRLLYYGSFHVRVENLPKAAHLKCFPFGSFLRWSIYIYIYISDLQTCTTNIRTNIGQHFTGACFCIIVGLVIVFRTCYNHTCIYRCVQPVNPNTPHFNQWRTPTHPSPPTIPHQYSSENNRRTVVLFDIIDID